MCGMSDGRPESHKFAQAAVAVKIRLHRKDLLRRAGVGQQDACIALPPPVALVPPMPRPLPGRGHTGWIGVGLGDLRSSGDRYNNLAQAEKALFHRTSAVNCSI